jgi:NAD(P)-dependent dehydrogenase (short-subunit alcohol dehydrogenase family)
VSGSRIGSAMLVTGASGGIGIEVARGIQELGILPVLVGRAAARLARAASMLPEPARAKVIAVDLSDADLAENTIRDQVDRLEWLTAAIMCAAVPGPEAPIEDVSLGEFLYTLRVNVLGTLVTCRAVLPIMRRQGSGNLVLFSSGAGMNVPRREVRSLAYQVSKFAIEGLVNGLAVELRGTGINVNGLRPGRTASGPNLRRPVPGLRPPRKAVAPTLFLATLNPGELSGFVLDAGEYEAGFRPARRDYTLPD